MAEIDPSVLSPIEPVRPIERIRDLGATVMYFLEEMALIQIASRQYHF